MQKFSYKIHDRAITIADIKNIVEDPQENKPVISIIGKEQTMEDFLAQLDLQSKIDSLPHLEKEQKNDIGRLQYYEYWSNKTTFQLFTRAFLVGFLWGLAGFVLTWIAYWVLRFVLMKITIPVFQWIKSGFADQSPVSEGANL